VSEQKGDIAVIMFTTVRKRPRSEHLRTRLRASWAILKGGRLSGLFRDTENLTSCSLT
jgi:hypothetical protein